MMKYKAGDKIVLHSLEWFDENERYCNIRLGLNRNMRKYFGKIQTIDKISTSTFAHAYVIKEEDDDDDYVYGDEMIDHDKTKDLHRRLETERRLRELTEGLADHEMRRRSSSLLGEVLRSPDSGDVLRSADRLQHRTIFNPMDYEWDVVTDTNRPSYLYTFPEYAAKFTPILDEGILYFTDEENNTYTLKELFEKHGKI